MGATAYPSESPAGKILDHLQRNGEATVKELEDVLGVSTTAVREHLTHLQAKELTTTKLVRRGPGRPHLVYSLTSKAQSLFPKSYDTLINVLLRELMNRVGPDEVENILESLSTQLAKEYNLQVSGAELSERLNALRHALEARGIPAEVHPTGDGFQLFACPYHDVAQEHAGVCTMERRMLEQVLGETIQIEGTIRDGHRSCQFSVGKPQ
jgi:predicted ArsR family transcriptional regulator